VLISPRRFRAAAALALLGTALNALWPLLANAEPRTDVFSNEICSVNKSKPGSVAGRLPPVQPPASHQSLHCVFCASGIGNVPVGTSPAVMVLAAASEPAPAAVAAFQFGNAALLFPESRAPPGSPLL
jgi:hypothetical protein